MLISFNLSIPSHSHFNLTLLFVSHLYRSVLKFDRSYSCGGPRLDDAMHAMQLHNLYFNLNIVNQCSTSIVKESKELK